MTTRVDVAASSQFSEDPRLIRRVLGMDPLVHSSAHHLIIRWRYLNMYR